MNIGFIDMFMNATLPAKLVLGLLLLMSVLSWTLIIYKFFSLRSARVKTRKGLQRFTDALDLREAVQLLSHDENSPVYIVARQGVDEFNRLKEAGNSGDVVPDNVRRALHQGVNESMGRLSSSLAFLAIDSSRDMKTLNSVVPSLPSRTKTKCCFTSPPSLAFTPAS